MAKRSPDEPLYVISVAARLVGVHEQTLRIYEREGLLKPCRTGRNVRLYSDRDIERLEYIVYLTQKKGINLAGVKMILAMQEKMQDNLIVPEMEKEQETLSKLQNRGDG